jgi:hypothetical protein
MKKKTVVCGLALAGLTAITILAGCGGTATPVISSVTPTDLSPGGGTAVTIMGKNFTPDVLVTFGGNPAPSVKWVNSQELIVVSPKSNTTASVPVAVGKSSLPNAVTYDLDGITCTGAVCTYAGDAYYNTLGSQAQIHSCTGSPDGNSAGNINANPGSYVIINDIQVPTTGNYTMNVYGATAAVRDFAAYVNGSTTMIDVNFVNPGSSWNAPAPPVAVQVPLQANYSNSIEFSGNPNGSYWSPDLCYITIGPGQ